MRTRRSSGWPALALCAAWLLTAPGAAPAAESGQPLRDAGDIPLYGVRGADTLHLEELQGEWVGLHFLLKADCPYCKLHTRGYAMYADAFPEVRHLFIKPGTAAAVERWMDSLMAANDPDEPWQEQPAVYRDEDGEVARRLGIPDGYEYAGETMHYPAFILIDPEGNEVFRHVGEHTGGRFPLTRFNKLMDTIKRPFDIDAMNLTGPGVVAIGGYDPVAYFTQDEAVEGDPDIAEVFHGIIVRFSSEAHREAFLEEPMRYLPEYGGWCAFNVARGQKRIIDPRDYRIHDGRLFLFNRGVFSSPRRVWDAEYERLIAEADAQWPTVAKLDPPEPDDDP